MINTAQLFVDVPRENGRFADEQSRDESTEHRVHADQISDERHDAHDHENGRDHCEIR